MNMENKLFFLYSLTWWPNPNPQWVYDEIEFSYLFTSSPAGKGNSCMSLTHSISVISTPLKWCTKFSLWIPLGGTTNCGFTEKSLRQMQWWANAHNSQRLPQATTQHVRKQRISTEVGSKTKILFDLELFSYWCYLIYIYVPFLSLRWAT